MNISGPPAVRRRGSDHSIPWDEITFRRSLANGDSIEITIKRSKLARLIAPRAMANSGNAVSSLGGAIRAKLLPQSA